MKNEKLNRMTASERVKYSKKRDKHDNSLIELKITQEESDTINRALDFLRKFVESDMMYNIHDTSSVVESCCELHEKIVKCLRHF